MSAQQDRTHQTLSAFAKLALLVTLSGIVLSFALLLVSGNTEVEPNRDADNVLLLDWAGHDESLILDLSQGWRFYANQLLMPNELASAEVNSQPVSIPHVWTPQNPPANTISHGTYVLNVRFAQTDQHYALLLPSIGVSFKLFANGDLIASGGEVGAEKSLTQPGYNSGVIPLHPEQSDVQLVLQVANFHYFWGGIWNSVSVGNIGDMIRLRQQEMMRSMTVIACFFTIAVFNLIHFSMRPGRYAPLLISISCLLLGAREAEESQLLSQLEIFQLSWQSYTRINFLTFYLSVPIILAFFVESFPADFHRRVVRTIYVICLAFSAMVLFPPSVFSVSMQFFQPLAVLIMAYTLWRMIVVVRNRRSGARFLMVGALVLFTLVINDILFNLGWVNTAYTGGLGLLIFVLCQSYLTYSRFVTASNDNIRLNTELQERNAQLESLSHSLEEKVNQRTSELASANEKLAVMANQDPLTGLLNRRGLRTLFDQSDEPRWQVQARSLLVIDFDHFKSLNDTHGHETGDAVLADGAQVMRDVVREMDLVARWGGEEFVILLAGTDRRGAAILAEKVRIAIAERVSAKVGFDVSVTIGVAGFAAQETLDACFIRADKALYQGKAEGRNRIVEAD